MYLIGYDVGSSSVKASLVEVETGKVVASDYFPKEEMHIIARRSGWAEQEPIDWWTNLKLAHQSVLGQSAVCGEDIKAIGITWQMHGLVLVDKEQQVLRPSIIWCDSRAVPYGEQAFKTIGQKRCLSHLLNSPGNFTASKLAWVKEHEPVVFDRIDKIMLPGDYIAMKLSGETSITIEGLSEAILWDFKKKEISADMLDYYDIPESFIPELKPIFGLQAEVCARAANELGLKAGTPISYRAGDQPNNAFSLNVLNPGEIASTAGTSGVVYGVSDTLQYDPLSRVNMFAHVNYTKDLNRLGILLCINGTGILNSWMRKNLATDGFSYQAMNEAVSKSPIGAKGLSVIPFGNGAERVLENIETDCSIHGINFNIHTRDDVMRAGQEGIVFSYIYGMQVMQSMGMEIKCIKAGYANMFLSPVFAQALCSASGAVVELYDTDGAAGAARGAGVGAGIYSSTKEAFYALQKLSVLKPRPDEHVKYMEAYQKWATILNNYKKQ